MTEFDAWLTPLRALLTLLLTVGGAFTGIIAWAIRIRSGVSAEIAAAQRVTDHKIGRLDDRVENCEGRSRDAERAVETMAMRVETLPSAAQMQQLHLDFAGLAGRLEVLNETMAGQRDIMVRVERSLDRHELFLTTHRSGG